MRERFAGWASLLRRGRDLSGLRFGVVGFVGGLCERRRRRWLYEHREGWFEVVVGQLLEFVGGYLVVRVSS